MLSVPLIGRELLMCARNPLQYRLRAGVGLLATIFVGAVFAGEPGARFSGLALYSVLHATVVITLLIVGPILTGDAISRERREGTLDLLFLTPLTSVRIISSKLFTQGLRLMTVWMATLPIAIVFELLLVAPFREDKLIWGRLAAVWSYYLPTALLLLCFVGLSLPSEHAFRRMELPHVHLRSLLVSAVTSPVAGLYFALRKSSFVATVSSTCIAALFVPYFVFDAIRFLAGMFDTVISRDLISPVFESVPLAVTITLLLHAVLISHFFARSVSALRARTFAF